MAEFLVPNDGVRGLDIESTSGITKLEADKRGIVSTDDPKLAKKLVAEGFTRAGVSLSIGAVRATNNCECGKVKFTYQDVCASCYAAALEEKRINASSD